MKALPSIPHSCPPELKAIAKDIVGRIYLAIIMLGMRPKFHNVPHPLEMGKLMSI